MLRWYSGCTRLRRELLGSAPTRLADVTVDVDEDARWVVMVHRPAGRPAYAVVVNLADHGQEVPLPGGGSRLLLAWDEQSTTLGAAAVTLPAEAAAVLSVP